MVKSARSLGLFVAILGVVWGGIAAAHQYRAGNIEIVHPWSRAMPKGAKVAAGYATIKNNGAEADKLIAATSEICEKAEIHMSMVKNNVASMHAMPHGVAIPANGSVEFDQGGMHIMLIGLKKPLVEGDTFKATLTFEKAGKVDVKFAVEQGQPAKAADPHANHKHH